MSISRRHALLSAFSSLRVSRGPAPRSARARRRRISTSGTWPSCILRRGVAGGEGKDRKRPRHGARIQGDAGAVSRALQAALDLNAAQDKALNRLATYASLKADEDTRVADYQGMRDQVIQLGAQAGSAWAFFEPEVLTLDAAHRGRVDRVDARAEAVRVLPARHPAPEGAHAQRERGSAHGPRPRPMAAGIGSLCEHPAQRGSAVADSHAGRRQAGEARRPGLLGGTRLGEPRGSQESDGGLLQRARRLPQDARAPR